ncbi:MAG TPA: FtsQ-type POTRA domain-containing protein [Mogibacterium sp.]|nr:FtsQ-type POTRA domain-containing protein [Mogibacterium sp.]
MSEKKSYGLPKEDYYNIDELRARGEQRKAKRLAKQKKARRRFIGVISTIVIIVGLFAFSLSSFFTVDSLEVRGNSHFTTEEIINISHASPGKNLIYNPNKTEITKYLENNPYIKKAKVTRGFPSTLIITVEERKQLCAIKYDDDYLIIDKDGILLKKTPQKPKLTLVKGIIVKKIELGETIEVKDETILKQTLTVLDKMIKGDLYFVKLEMSDQIIKAYIYDSLIVKATFKQLTEALEKNRLHAILERLFDERIKRGTITFTDDGFASYEPQL